MAKNPDAAKDTRTCPECGAKVARSILLCDCGYHFQTKRILEKTDVEASDDATLAAAGAALADDRFEAPPRVWLLRSAKLLRLLAGLNAAGTVVWGAVLLTIWLKAADRDGTSIAEQSSAGGLLTLLLVLFGGFVSFVLLMGASEAATALRDLERYVLGSRRSPVDRLNR